MNKIIQSEFEKLIALTSCNEESLNSFDTLYYLCKKFVDEVDKCVKEGMSFDVDNSEEELG